MAHALRSHAILAQLAWRNRIVGLLRLAVPLFGLTVFASIVIQFVIAGYASHYGIAGLSIDRGHLIVERPHYSGAGADGMRYDVKADKATAKIDAIDNVSLSLPLLDLTLPGRAPWHASAQSANVDGKARTVTIPGVVKLYGDDGLRGTATDVVAGLDSSDISAAGPVDMYFPDGTRLTGASMVRKADEGLWTFENATLTMDGLPHAALPIPFGNSAWVVK